MVGMTAWAYSSYCSCRGKTIIINISSLLTSNLEVAYCCMLLLCKLTLNSFKKDETHFRAFLCQANQAGSSSNMEVLGHQKALAFLLGTGMVIKAFISDRHLTITK